MQNTESFLSQTFLPVGKTPAISASFDVYAEEKSNCDILIFSREVETRFLLKTLFEMWGYQIKDFDLTKDSLPIIEQHQPKIIVVDSFLPFEESLEFVAEIRQHKTEVNIPVTLISGFPEKKYREISFEAGAHSFFEKPVNFNLLQNYLEGEILRLNRQTPVNG